MLALMVPSALLFIKSIVIVLVSICIQSNIIVFLCLLFPPIIVPFLRQAGPTFSVDVV